MPFEVESEMILVRVQLLLFNNACSLAPSRRLPIVFLTFGLRNPRGQRLHEIAREGEYVRLVHAAEFRKAAISGFAVVKVQAVLRERIANAAQVRFGKAVLRQIVRRRTKNLRKINNGVASDGES